MAEKKGRILAIDDNEDILFSLRLYLKQHFDVIRTTSKPESIPAFMNAEEYDVILLDMNFTQDAISGQEGFSWLAKILEIEPEAVVVFMTAYGDAEKAVRSIKAGATDFVLKPWQNEKLLATLHAAIELRQSKRETKSLKSKQEVLSDQANEPFRDFIGKSSGMQDVFRTIEKVAKTDANVLILGENGTGKELVARALHMKSLRKEDVFVSVDMGAITETLFESELFGHMKGAFTDAKKDRPGRFEIATGGTIFLDEIGNLSLPLQSKLLTVIEKGEVTRVGANKPYRVDARLICATNSDITSMVSSSDFRQDLLYRINTVEIHLPPLRERVVDIPILADHFLRKFNKKYKKSITGIAPSTMQKLKDYKWPGNVRELQHAIERAVIMSDSPQLQPDDFFFSTSKQSAALDFETYNLDEVEEKLVRKVMQRHNGNISHAARDLGLTRTSLYRRLEKYGI